MNSLQWKCLPFDALSLLELYQLLGLRQAIFVVEQNCPYQDVDGIDPDAHHLMAFDGDQLIAYTRLIPPGRVYAEPSIGRVVVADTHRRQGIAHELMRRSIGEATRLWGKQAIQIGAQQYLVDFYQQHGFAVTGEPYLEDGIPHVHMLRG